MKKSTLRSLARRIHHFLSKEFYKLLLNFLTILEVSDLNNNIMLQHFFIEPFFNNGVFSFFAQYLLVFYIC